MRKEGPRGARDLEAVRRSNQVDADQNDGCARDRHAQNTRQSLLMDSARDRQTFRLHLRPVELQDRDAFLEIHADPRTNVHTPGGPPAQEWIEGMLAGVIASWENSGMSYWSVEVDRRVIGVAGVEVHKILGRDCWNLYYRFAPEAWGQGYAAEAAREAVEVAQLIEPPRPIVARTRSANTPAIRVAERAGLVRRPDLDHEGFVVLAANW